MVGGYWSRYSRLLELIEVAGRRRRSARAELRLPTSIAYISHLISRDWAWGQMGPFVSCQKLSLDPCLNDLPLL